MCGIYHSRRRTWSGWIKAHMCGKNHCQFVFLRSGKNQTCVAFTKHIPNTKVCDVENTNVCKNPNMCVIFHTGYATFCVCDCIWVFYIWYDIISIHIISDAYMQYQTSKTPSK